MDYDVVFVGDERNSPRVTDHRSPRPSSGWSRPPSRTVIVPPGARPTVITGGASAPGWYRPQYAQQYVSTPDPYSIASRFGMTTGELIDAGIQILAAIQGLPNAPTAQGDISTDVENMLTYQTALWQHAKRDEQLRTLGGLLARILR